MPMKDLTPTERAQLHAKQRAAKDARARSNFSPGPGQYDTDRVDRKGSNGTLSDMRGEGSATWSFTSRSIQRRSVVGAGAQTKHIGPGAYSPQRTTKGENDTLASTQGEGNFASATMNSKVSRGSPFGPNTSLVQQYFVEGPHVPAPASYAPQQDSKGRNWEVSQTKGEDINLGSAAFVSKSKHRPELLRDEGVPGPGKYEPMLDERGDNAEVSSMRGEGATTGGSAFMSKTIQRPNAKQSAAPGPGSYDPIATRVGENASVADMRGEEGGYAFYGNSERLDVIHYAAPTDVIDMVDGGSRVTH